MTLYKTLKRGEQYSLLENKEYFLITKRDRVYFAISKESVKIKEMYKIYDEYERDNDFVNVLMEIYDIL